jgi:CheY-like chemotaxis protein
MSNTPIKVLIADDDYDDVQLLKEVLHNFLPDAHVNDVPDGIACLRYIKTLPPPDLLFSI